MNMRSTRRTFLNSPLRPVRCCSRMPGPRVNCPTHARCPVPRPPPRTSFMVHARNGPLEGQSPRCQHARSSTHHLCRRGANFESLRSVAGHAIAAALEMRHQGEKDANRVCTCRWRGSPVVASPARSPQALARQAQFQGVLIRSRASLLTRAGRSVACRRKRSGC